MEEVAAAVRKADPSLSPPNLSSVLSAVIGYNPQEGGNVELPTGSQTAEVSTHEIS